MQAFLPRLLTTPPAPFDTNPSRPVPSPTPTSAITEYPDLDGLFNLHRGSQYSSQTSSQSLGTVTSHGDGEAPLPEPTIPSRRPNETPQEFGQYPPSH